MRARVSVCFTLIASVLPFYMHMKATVLATVLKSPRQAGGDTHTDVHKLCPAGGGAGGAIWPFPPLTQPGDLSASHWLLWRPTRSFIPLKNVLKVLHNHMEMKLLLLIIPLLIIINIYISSVIHKIPASSHDLTEVAH